jgi:energy-coupling factor transporter transmembrane protein EcfT
VWGLTLALVVHGWWLGGLAALEVIVGLMWSREGLRPLSRLRFWFFIVGAIVAGLLVHRKAGLMEAGVSLPWEGLSMGLEMAIRATAVTLAFSLGLSAFSLSDLMAMFDRLGMRGLGFALGMAMNLLSNLQEMAVVTFQTIKLRGGFRRPIVALRLFLVTMISNTLRTGDQVVSAALVRAFDPNRGLCIGPSPHWADLWLLIVLISYSVACWVL